MAEMARSTGQRMQTLRGRLPDKVVAAQAGLVNLSQELDRNVQTALKLLQALPATQSGTGPGTSIK